MLEGKVRDGGHVEIPLPAFDAESIFGPSTSTLGEMIGVTVDQHGRTRASSVASSSSTLPPATPVEKPSFSRRRTQPEPISRIFIKDLPNAEHEALSTFSELRENDFQAKGLGRSNQQEEMMVCDCTFDEGELRTLFPGTLLFGSSASVSFITDEDDPDDACGFHSNCINRMTQVECLNGQCQTRGHCQNQRYD